MSAPDCQFTTDAETIHVAASELPAPGFVADQVGRTGAISLESLQALLGLCERLAEFSATALAVFAAYCLCSSMNLGRQLQFVEQQALAAGAFTGIVVVLLLYADRAHCAIGSPLQIRETERAVQASALAMLALLPINHFFHLDLSAAVLLIALSLTLLSLILERHLFVSGLRLLRAKGIDVERTAIYADVETGRRIASLLQHSPRLGLLPVAVVDANPLQTDECNSAIAFPRLSALPMQRGPLTPARLKAWRCDLLVVAATLYSAEKLIGIAQIANQAGCRLALLPTLSIASSQSMEWLHTGDPFLTAITDENPSRFYVPAKRVVDILLAFVLLVAFAPLLLVIALLVRLDSPGPALFAQKRVGLRGKLFDIYKFRSMHVGVPRYELSPASSRDRRITRIGRWLRRTSLDELPQLFNVLMGSMSLVGPRPEMPFLVERHIAQHVQRLQAKPGITGLWQLSPARAEQIHENPEYDHYYIRNRTCYMDVAILIHTLLFAVRGV
jgi:exopolysaccharide biosynthesis polyprenyl glycosylphosphotransferase